MPDCAELKNKNTGQRNRMEMPEINLYTQKFYTKPDEIKEGNNHYLITASGKVGNCSVGNTCHTFQMR